MRKFDEYKNELDSIKANSEFTEDTVDKMMAGIDAKAFNVKNDEKSLNIFKDKVDFIDKPIFKAFGGFAACLVIIAAIYFFIPKPEDKLGADGIKSTNLYKSTTNEGVTTLPNYSDITFNEGFSERVSVEMFNKTSAKIISDFSQLSQSNNYYTPHFPAQKINLPDKYNEKFFDDKSLIILEKENTSGSYSNRIQSISLVDNEAILYVISSGPSMITNDMAYWIHIIEVDKKDLSGVSKIHVKEDTEENPYADSPIYIIMDVRKSSLLLSNPSAPGSLYVANYKPYMLYGKDDLKNERLEFKIRQEVRLSYELIQESYPAVFGNLKKIMLVNESASDEDYKIAAEAFNNYISNPQP